MLNEGESVPEIFEDPVVKRASHWVLSTSALFSKHLREYGWGEVRLIAILLPALTSCTGRARWLRHRLDHRIRRYVLPACFARFFFLCVAWKTNVMGMKITSRAGEK